MVGLLVRRRAFFDEFVEIPQYQSKTENQKEFTGTSLPFQPIGFFILFFLQFYLIWLQMMLRLRYIDRSRNRMS